jgi:hypothetical protein
MYMTKLTGNFSTFAQELLKQINILHLRCQTVTRRQNPSTFSSAIMHLQWMRGIKTPTPWAVSRLCHFISMWTSVTIPRKITKKEMATKVNVMASAWFPVQQIRPWTKLQAINTAEKVTPTRMLKTEESEPLEYRLWNMHTECPRKVSKFQKVI